MAAAQVPSSYDPNAPTYQPGTQDQGDTPSLKPAVQKAPATPALPVASTGLSTDPVKPPPTGLSATPTLPVAPGQTSDPLAFATGTFNTTGSPATTGQPAQTGDANPQDVTQPSGTAQPPVYTPPPLYSGPNAPPDTRAMSGQDAAAAQQAYNDSAAKNPLSGMTEAQKAQYWAGQGVTGLAYGATPTGSTGNPNAGGAVSTYNPLQVASNDAALAAAGKNDPLVQSVQARQAAALGQENTGIQSQDTQNNANSVAALDAALNGQPGYAGSGNAYADPNNPGGTVANPLDASHTAPATPGDQYVGNGPQVDPATLAYQQSHPSGTPGSTPITQASTGTPATSSSPTSGATLTGPVSTAGPINSQPTLTPLTPDNALTNSIISPNSNVDRFAVAKQQIQDEIQNELEPQFNADARTVAAQSFGAGRGVSGANRTAEGNLALQHSRDINQLTSNYLNPALTGTIQDTLNNANFAAGQQQFEAGQQNTAYNQQTGLQQLADSENQQQFNQALQKLIVGSQGDPAQLQLLLSELYGGQSAQSSQAAQNLAKSAVG